MCDCDEHPVLPGGQATLVERGLHVGRYPRRRPAQGLIRDPRNLFADLCSTDAYCYALSGVERSTVNSISTLPSRSIVAWNSSAGGTEPSRWA